MRNSNIQGRRRVVNKSVEKVDNSPSHRQATTVLAVFAKAPLAGQVKTRLSPPLRPEQAAQLYRVALDETLQRFSGQSFELVIFYAGAEDYFASNYPQLPRQAQVGNDLGERMANALRGLLQAGYQQVALIGSDSPDLPLSCVEQAFVVLRRSDVVIAPAADGGYVLIGESCHHPQLFESMPWSCADLMRQTARVLAEQRIDWRQLATWEDIDDAESLRRLLLRSPESTTARHIREQLASMPGEA
jgi:rSAM/selenodomain-associated transferase 1